VTRAVFCGLRQEGLLDGAVMPAPNIRDVMCLRRMGGWICRSRKYGSWRSILFICREVSRERRLIRGMKRLFRTDLIIGAAFFGDGFGYACAKQFIWRDGFEHSRFLLDVFSQNQNMRKGSRSVPDNIRQKKKIGGRLSGLKDSFLENRIEK